jgi:hypothetical protein
VQEECGMQGTKPQNAQAAKFGSEIGLVMVPVPVLGGAGNWELVRIVLGSRRPVIFM